MIPVPPPAIHAPAPETGLRDSMALSCGSGTHAHALELNQDGSYVVHSYPDEKNQPDILMDGKCHSDGPNDEVVGDRKVLPVPGRNGS